MSHKNYTCIACSIFKDEIEHLIAEGKINLPFVFIDSMLHMHPEKLQKELDERINKILSKEDNVLLLYGECHNHMDDYHKNNQIKKVCGVNCIEIILGEERYNTLLKSGAFFMLNEWVIRWQTVFEQELGLTSNTAKDLMRQMHKYIVYIDTGFKPVPTEALEDASRYTGLPYKTIQTDNSELLKAINKAIEL